MLDMATDTAVVRDNPEAERFEIQVDGEVAGFAAYRRRPGVIAFVHTEVEPRFEGHGIGGRLVSAALDEVRIEGLKVYPFCPFVQSYIQEHRDYADLVPAEQWETFGL